MTHSPMFGSQRGNIRAFEVMEALREAESLQAQGRHIIHFSLGQPGTRAPHAVFDAVTARMHDNHLGYTEARGLLALRERIARFYHDSYQIHVDPAQIFVTVGSSSAYFLGLLAACDAGDRVAISRPCYPAYPNMARALNLEPVFIDTDETTRFQPTVDMLAQAHQRAPLKALVIASPSNPAGTVIDKPHMEALVAYCKEHNILLFSDEIYHGITFDAHTKPCSALECSADNLVLNSFSKYFLLPGWRLGWAVVPSTLLRRYESLVQSFFISPAAPAQYAALEVFNHLDELQAVVSHYHRNRDVLINALNKAGFAQLIVPEGAFYIYTNIDQFGITSTEFCRKLLHEAGVSAVPGHDFDEMRGNSYVRFSFAGSAEDVREGAARIQQWVSASMTSLQRSTTAYA